jgi:hypothetical protein
LVVQAATLPSAITCHRVVVVAPAQAAPKRESEHTTGIGQMARAYDGDMGNIRCCPSRRPQKHDCPAFRWRIIGGVRASVSALGSGR